MACWDLHRHDGVRVVVSYLWVKLYTSAELKKAIRIAVPTILGELRCGLTTSVYFGMGWCELFWICVRQLCHVLRRTGSPVAVLKLELRVTIKTDF